MTALFVRHFLPTLGPSAAPLLSVRAIRGLWIFTCIAHERGEKLVQLALETSQVRL